MERCKIIRYQVCKILDRLELRRLDVALASQNLYSKDFTDKVLRNKELADWGRREIFPRVRAKILVLRKLAGSGWGMTWQNIDSQGLSDKILWNKELALDVIEVGFMAEKRLGEAARIGQGCSFLTFE
jgi:nucleoid-associated protein YejK